MVVLGVGLGLESGVGLEKGLYIVTITATVMTRVKCSRSVCHSCGNG